MDVISNLAFLRKQADSNRPKAVPYAEQVCCCSGGPPCSFFYNRHRAELNNLKAPESRAVGVVMGQACVPTLRLSAPDTGIVSRRADAFAGAGGYSGVGHGLHRHPAGLDL
jgi:hypothetical protein